MLPVAPFLYSSSSIGMGWVGTYSHTQFATAPLLAGDFAVYFSQNNKMPSSGSGNPWTKLGGYLGTKVIEQADIGVQLFPGDADNGSAVAIVYRGPASLLKARGPTFFGASPMAGIARDDKHLGLLCLTEEINYRKTLTTPQAFFMRKSMSATTTAAAPRLKLWDRLEPANPDYTSNEPIGYTQTASSAAYLTILEFLAP